MSVLEQTLKRPKPTYAILNLFPSQGDWTEEEYLTLDTNHLVELTDGCLEVKEMPTDFHQLVLGRLFAAMLLFVTASKLGYVRFSPLRVRLWPGKFREPDLIFMAVAHKNRLDEQYWGVPDLVAEVISESDPDLDRVVKMGEYAQAGIPEYWLVDPAGETIEIFLLRGSEYQLSQALREGDRLTSTQLPGFEMSVTELFAEE
jgi:Uma2 family endonuclease